MQFPKKRMTTSELIKIGFTKDELLVYAHKKGQTYATQKTKGGSIKWDTDRFQKALDKELVRT